MCPDLLCAWYATKPTGFITAPHVYRGQSRLERLVVLSGVTQPRVQVKADSQAPVPGAAPGLCSEVGVWVQWGCWEVAQALEYCDSPLLSCPLFGRQMGKEKQVCFISETRPPNSNGWGFWQVRPVRDLSRSLRRPDSPPLPPTTPHSFPGGVSRSLHSHRVPETKDACPLPAATLHLSPCRRAPCSARPSALREKQRPRSHAVPLANAQSTPESVTIRH